jgi:hypothetical protein
MTMIAAKIETTVQDDGELRLSDLPCRKGDRVEVIVSILDGEDASRDQQRSEARERFLARARASTFCSRGSYPSRDELHERH